MENKIEEFLMNQFECWTNDLNEEIVSVIVGNEEIYIDTEIVVNLEVSNNRDFIIMQDDPYKRRKWATRNFISEELIDELTENYATGFYCHYFEGLSIHDFINSSDIVCEENSNVAIYIDMQYVMDRAEIEALMEGYKECA